MTNCRCDEPGIATGLIVGAAATLALGGATVAYVATDGFGNRPDDPESISATDPADPGQAEPATTTGMTASESLLSGRFAECTYTHEGYDVTVTLRSEMDYRIDQATQGGQAHVLHGPTTTYVWIDGMESAYRYASMQYDLVAAQQTYPTFEPDDFLGVAAPPDVCRAKETIDESTFTLPAGMVAVPGPLP